MSPEPLRLALFGHPVGHSRSAEIFAAHAARGGPSVRYQVVDVPPGELPAALARLERGEWQGANVTVPHKIAAAEACAGLEGDAARAGAVNVLVVEERGLLGANSDGQGFLDGLAANGCAADSALLLGAGGAARGVAAALVREGAGISVVTRTPETLPKVFRVMGAEALAWEERVLRDALAAHPLVIQCTPLGTAPAAEGCVPLPFDALGPGHLAVDLVYNPWETTFLGRARAAGARGLNGWPMLVHQAARALERWAGADAARGLPDSAREIESRDPLARE